MAERIAVADPGTTKPVESLADLLSTLAGTDFFRLTSNEVAAIHRRIGRLRAGATAPDLRIAYQGSHTIEPLPAFVGVRCACAGMIADQWVGEFNQYQQEVLRPDSELAAFDPQLILLSVSLRDIAPRIETEFEALGADEKRAEIERIVAHLRAWAEAAKAATGASLLIANFPSPGFLRAGIADLKAGFGEREFYARLNLALLDAFRDDARAHVFDLDRLVGRVGSERAFNARMHYLARMPWDARLLPAIADEVYRYAHALLGRTRKCLVVDLDNTLWGGVLGEEGPDGVEIGPGTPWGEAFEAFQRRLLALKRRGVLLAVSSKNNPGDVKEMFARGRMPLREDDFAAVQINWEHKHDGVRRIAEALNIGVDSLVFVDDNPAECEIVRQMVPGVEVVELPRDPAEYPDLVARLIAFETLRVTDEDRVKSQQYLENRRRSELLEKTAGGGGDLGAYLASLETVVSIRRATARDAARLHQLFLKTNQFNVTTKRYAAADVERFLADGERFDFRAVDVRDRFGDLGTVGLVLIDRGADEEPVLDSFILSCRAMGREVETAIVNRLKADYLLDGPYPALVGVYLPTKKNIPVAELYAKQGFDLVEATEGGGKRYRLARERCGLLDCAHITTITTA